MLRCLPVPGSPIIRVNSVEKSYGIGAARTHVLRKISVEINQGEMVAMVGQSGSGKSTLLNIIGGLDQPDSGEVEVLGLNLQKASEPERAALRNEKIGFVFQAFNLLDHLSCLDNVTLPSKFSRKLSHDVAKADERAMESLRRVGMADLAKRRPSELSGGQKQRVAIARALFASPTLLLCDEPTGNLDSQTGKEVIDFFRELNTKDNVTLLIVTHERRVSSIAQRVIAMKDGKIVETTDEALAEAGPS